MVAVRLLLVDVGLLMALVLRVVVVGGSRWGEPSHAANLVLTLARGLRVVLGLPLRMRIALALGVSLGLRLRVRVVLALRDVRGGEWLSRDV